MSSYWAPTVHVGICNNGPRGPPSHGTRKVQHPVLQWHGSPGELQNIILELLARGHRRSDRASCTSGGTNGSVVQAFVDILLHVLLSVEIGGHFLRSSSFADSSSVSKTSPNLADSDLATGTMFTMSGSALNFHHTTVLNAALVRVRKQCARTNAIIRKAFCGLFTILSNWGERNLLDANSGGHGLTLEISAHSPSDSEHCFQNISFDDLSDEDDVCVPDDAATAGSVAGGPSNPATSINQESSVGRSTHSQHLLIRRQTRRSLSLCHSTLRHIMKSLLGLESVWLEIWKRECQRIQANNDRGCATRDRPRHTVIASRLWCVVSIRGLTPRVVATQALTPCPTWTSSPADLNTESIVSPRSPSGDAARVLELPACGGGGEALNSPMRSVQVAQEPHVMVLVLFLWHPWPSHRRTVGLARREND
ncbi:Uncharacterized protein TPAR_05260 [Tolypocladium paradoxum]|uniref:Uncharacterized protein n=1 Tax=Tolypocladium paradoxum TaxID=94208 RepID=A0A2S4KWF7_9HYPO|nr:Uncharacterized protein TPAR_05260 [Tolypocladium paradoxum]